MSLQEEFQRGRADSFAARFREAEQDLKVLRAAMHEIAMGSTPQGYVNEETVMYADGVLKALASEEET